MHWLTEDAILQCDHGGMGFPSATQNLVRIDGRRVLVEPDPEGVTIVGCPNVGPTIKPCALTLPVQRGYCEWVRIEGWRICLDGVSGLTEGTPPGTVDYTVRRAGQALVVER